MSWSHATGHLVDGHGVASGRGGDPRFPGGSLAMQAPHFAAKGLDLSVYHPGTLNLSLAPHRFELGTPAWHFPHLAWHPTEPPETFSFFSLQVRSDAGSPWQEALVYWPHPETKPEHQQPADVLEILTGFLPNVRPGVELLLRARSGTLWFREP